MSESWENIFITQNIWQVFIFIFLFLLFNKAVDKPAPMSQYNKTAFVGGIYNADSDFKSRNDEFELKERRHFEVMTTPTVTRPGEFVVNVMTANTRPIKSLQQSPPQNTPNNAELPWLLIQGESIKDQSMQFHFTLHNKWFEHHIFCFRRIVYGNHICYARQQGDQRQIVYNKLSVIF